jgi:hypothetical protein
LIFIPRLGRWQGTERLLPAAGRFDLIDKPTEAQVNAKLRDCAAI